MDWLTDPQIWIALATLTFLEIVLGVDNIIFISILSGKLPENQQVRARRVGLLGAMLMRVGLLFSLAWLSRLTEPIFTLGRAISGRDLVLIGGGLFLLGKSTFEIHGTLEGEEEHGPGRVAASFASVIAQIMLLDIVFSLDSVITAIGMVDELWVMVTAVVVSVAHHDGRGRADQRVRPQAPDRQDAGAQLPAAHRPVAHPRGGRPAHSEGLHLLRDGVLGVRGDDQPAAAEEGETGPSPRSLCEGRAAEPRQSKDVPAATPLPAFRGGFQA